MKIILFVFIFVLLLIFGTLIKNDAHLFDEPGVSKRLKTFLTTNVARTTDDHEFPELVTPVYDVNADELYRRLVEVGIILGWHVADNNAEIRMARFMVQTGALAFRDDVLVRVNAIDGGKTTLYIRSSSRTGRADFAANSAHIQKLVNALR